MARINGIQTMPDNTKMLVDFDKPIIVWELEKGIVMSGIITGEPIPEHMIYISADTGNPETDLPHGPYDLANVYQDTPGMRKALGEMTMAYDQARVSHTRLLTE